MLTTARQTRCPRDPKSLLGFGHLAPLGKKQGVGEEAGPPRQWDLLRCPGPTGGALGWPKPSPPPSPRAAGGVSGSGRHFPAHLRGEGAGGEEAAAGNRRELRLGVGRGLLCWELSSGSHQRGGREGAAFPGPHTPAGPVGTQPDGPQPPSPAWGSLPCPASPLAPLAQACYRCWPWAARA